MNGKTRKRKLWPQATLLVTLFAAYVFAGAAAAYAQDFSRTIDEIMSPNDRSAVEAVQSERYAPLDDLMVPESRTITGYGAKELIVTCPCDVHWISRTRDFAISILPNVSQRAAQGTQIGHAQIVTSETVIQLMQSVRGSSHVTTSSSGNGRGRLHLSAPIEHRVNITAAGRWELTILTMP